MKFRKTSSSARKDYNYEFTLYSDDNESELSKTVIITPGMNGVTDVDIEWLHNADDQEIYNNEKNHRSDFNDKGKEERQEWKDAFREQFREQHGYYPNADDTEYFCKEAFKCRWALSLDKATDDYDDKTPLIEEVAYIETESTSKLEDCIEDFRLTLPEVKRFVFDNVMLNDMKKKDAASHLGLSDTRVSQITKELEKSIKSNRLLIIGFNKNSYE